MSARAPALDYVQQACGCCPPRPVKLGMHDYLHPGFGILRLLKDGEDVWGDVHGEIQRPLIRCENIARREPDCDWRLSVEGPMYGVVYQRHGRNEWVAVERLDGFA